MTETATPAVTGPGAGDPAATATTGADVKYATAEEVEGYKKFTNKELAGLRKGTENLVTVEKLNEILDSRLPAPAATGNGKGEKDLAAAEHDRRLKAVEEELAQKKREVADGKISTAIAASTKGVLEGMEEILQDALRARARLDGEAVVIDTPDGPTRLTAEYVRTLKGSESWYPSSGKPGTGLPTGGGATASGVDFDLAMKDQAYFDKNKAAVIAEMDRRRKAGI